MNRAANALLGSWQVNGILTLHTGSPVHDPLERLPGTNGILSARPRRWQGPEQAEPAGGRNTEQWFDITAVTGPSPLTGGNLGLQSNTAPATRTLDFSVFKDFRFNERWRLQFRTEAINFANTPQWGTPNNNLQDAAFGKVTSTFAGSQRNIQMALRLMF